MIATRRPGFNTVGRVVSHRFGYIALGTNLGDRVGRLRAGLAALADRGLEVVDQSSVWETEPVDCPDSCWFLNMAVRVRTQASPLELLDLLLDAERCCGRVRGVRNAPRELDLDLLLLDDLQWRDSRLCLPHPRMWDRRFVLEPLGEIGPDLCDPASGITVARALERLRSRDLVRRLGPLELAV
jgi:2-amino-4-hydroxy-6-hydroxymethyldihydropteridine diphosphokinase